MSETNSGDEYVSWRCPACGDQNVDLGDNEQFLCCECGRKFDCSEIDA